MTGPTLLTILCQFINTELGIKAIKGPSNNSAPAERPYVTVYLQNVRQVGDRFIPGPVRGAQAPIFIDGGNVAATGEAATGDVPVRKYKAVMQVANVQFYGVEDDGEALRKIRNALQSDEFDSFVAAHVTPREDGDDAGFSVWEIGDIVDNGFQDGTFYVQQKTMVADFQFYDFIEHTTPRMESVDLSLNNEQQFHVEVNDG
jgi:hypothetical protein